MATQKKIAFIIPYFGSFNNYFEVWLHSCRFNATIDWLIFTDDKKAYTFPPNVKVFYTTFEETVKKMQSKFDFKIILNNPYQLCEFKITYGEVYEEYLAGYDFWGYCDVDVVWGNLRRHITNEILDTHEKISWRGHMTLFRNEYAINRLYRNKIEGIEFYKYVLANETGFPLASDEREINYIFEEAGYKIYKELLFADLKIRSFNFFLLHFDAGENRKNSNQVFLWRNGELLRIYTAGDKTFTENFAYVHFLKRQMSVEKKFTLSDRFLIVPNKFVNIKETVSVKLINELSKKKFYYSYFKEKITLSYFFDKIKYLRSKKLFKSKYGFLPLKPTHVILPPVSKLSEYKND
ncbi:MAG: hypothetical protein JST87_15975 [Bacteroidetes bacterium]|nr:hypothetical protein [Bacteroidota bacterium]